MYFYAGRFFCWGLKLCCGQEGSRAAQRLERAAGKRLHVLLILSWRSGGGNSIRNSVRSVHQAGDDLQYLGNGNLDNEERLGLIAKWENLFKQNKELHEFRA